LRKVDVHVIAPHEFEEAPELTDEQLAKAVLSVDGKRRGSPPSERPKQAIKLQLDADIISAYRATGEGWQRRINADLRRARKLSAPQRRKASR
jgi:uncharacterized protein (DUF4415 family)